METSALTLKRGDRVRFVDQDKDQAIEGLFIGTANNGDLVVVPLSENRSQTPAGTTLQGHCRFEEQMVTFTARLRQVIDQPVTLWQIHAPGEVKRYDLRDAKRIQCSLSASIEGFQEGRMITGILRDISKTGARCVFLPAADVQAPFAVDEAVTLRCVFPGIPGEQVAKGTIIDIQRTKADLSIGLRFTESVWWVPPYH